MYCWISYSIYFHTHILKCKLYLFCFFRRFENKHFYINLIYYLPHFLQNVLLKVFSQITFTLQVIYELFGNRLSHSVKWTILFKSIQKKYNTYQNPSNGMILIQAYGQFFFSFPPPSTIIVLNSPIFGCQIHIR